MLWYASYLPGKCLRAVTVQSASGGGGVEAVVVSGSQVCDTVVQGHKDWKPTWEVSPGSDRPVGGGVEPVVVPRSEVRDAVE